MKRNWKPSRAAARAFAQEMDDIRFFCLEHGIDTSRSGDSYYFSVNGQRYRVSNHSVEASNAGAVSYTGEKLRELYHENGREFDVIYIHASKTRIRQIWQDLNSGKRLDGRGNPV